MTGRRTARLWRIPALAVPAALPGLAVLAGLTFEGILAPGLALIAAAFILLMTALVISRLVIAIGVLGESIDELAAELTEQAPARGLVLGPAVPRTRSG